MTDGRKTAGRTKEEDAEGGSRKVPLHFRKGREWWEEARGGWKGGEERKKKVSVVE